MKPNAVGRANGQDPQSHPVPDSGLKAGLVKGTILLTQEGEMPVEFLSPGDRIITRDSGLVRLEHLAHHHTLTRAISFAAGSLGHTRPDQDLILPASQMVLIRDWRARAMFGAAQALVQAATLVDDEFVCDLGVHRMMLYQLHFDTPHVIYAGGLELSCMSDTETCLRPAA